MTTLDTLMDVGARAEAAAERRRANPVDWRRVLIGLLVLVPYVLGFIAGKAWRGLLFAGAAMQDGYARGRAAPAPSAPRPSAAVASRE